MGGWRKAARRLASAATIALALLTAGVVVPTDWAPARPAGGWGQPAGPRSAFGYAPPPGGRAPVLGVVGYKPAVLTRLDPRTLRPLSGPRLRLRYGISSYGWSPDRSLLALGDVDDDKLHLVDPVRLRRLASLDFGIVAEAPQSLAWVGPRRLAVVADDRGRIRTVELPGIDAGFQPPPDWDQPGAHGVIKGATLAVDPEGGRAFVVAAGAGVTEVDLTSLRVTARRLRQPASLLRRLAHWLVPPAQAKLNAGTWRDACWLGDGRLAVWGSETRLHGDAPGDPPPEERPSGLRLIDTRSWTVRPVDPAATQASWQEGRLLAFGGTWDYQAERQVGAGLTVYGPGGRPQLHLLGGQAVMEAHLNGDLVYAAVDTGAEEYASRVVSLRTGRALASSDAPLPLLLLGGRDQSC
jgi:hypothetical protein